MAYERKTDRPPRSNPAFTNPNRRICGAKNKAGKPCRRSPSKGRDRCRKHGGASLQGPAHPSFKSGKYSKVLPARYLAAYRDSVNDKHLMTMREQIAMCDARERELVERLSGNESGEAWNALRAANRTLRQSIQRRDEAGIMAAVQSIDSIVERGLRDESQWEDLRRNMDQRHRLVDGERKLLEASSEMATKDEVRIWAARLGSLISKYVTDKQLLSQLLVELSDTATEHGFVQPAAEENDETSVM